MIMNILRFVGGANKLFSAVRGVDLLLLRGNIFQKFVESEKFTRFCQWKNLELNLQLSMNDFSVHRIIGRGGFGEVKSNHFASHFCVQPTFKVACSEYRGLLQLHSNPFYRVEFWSRGVLLH